MQDLQEEKSQKKKKGLRRQVELPVALSVIVAAFALFSVASFGLINRQTDTVSYAAPSSDFNMVMRDTDSTEGPAGVTGSHEGGTTYFYTPFYWAGSATDENRIFCVEHGVDANNGFPYSPESEVEDAGLIYILQHSYANGVPVVGNGAKDYVEIWATQAALWLYQHETHAGDTKHALPATGLDSIEELQQAKVFTLMDGSTATTEKTTVDGVYTKVRALVDAAKKATGESTFSFTINRAGDMKKTEDGKYFQTGIISIVGSPADALISYDIVLPDDMKDLKVVDENGKDLALTDIPANKKFYLRIPASKVSDKTVNIKYNINANYEYETGTYYVSTGHQTVAALDYGVNTLQKGDNFNIVGTPPTGMNAAQTIYFIGLIVLLCGVGIVYANTKPVESKQ